MKKNKIQKTKWKAGNMVYPIPAAMVSCGDSERANIVTVGWTGTICTNPPMTYISLRPSRFSYDLIKTSGYFVINLTTKSLVRATDFCGVKSGRDIDKFQAMDLTVIRDEDTGCPMIGESPVSIVCKTKEIRELGSHHMFIADVMNVYIDEKYLDEKGKFHLNATDLIAYSHGSYLSLGEELGSFGYSICKTKKKDIKIQKGSKSFQANKIKDESTDNHRNRNKSQQKAKKKYKAESNTKKVETLKNTFSKKTVTRQKKKN